MSKFHIEIYTPKLFDKWNKFIDESNNGTIFHRLDFLDYHGERFKNNEKHLIWYKGESIFSLMPLGIFMHNMEKIAKSPYGASYGGIIFSKTLNYSDSKMVVNLLVDFLTENKINELYLTLPIKICHKNYSETFNFALLEHGFKLINSDISSVVCLDSKDIENETFTSRARNMARKARKLSVTTQLRASIEDYWQLHEQTFDKLKKRSTHSFEEWRWLCTNLPDNFWCDVAYFEDKPIAGIGHVKINDLVDSSFYLVKNSEYQQTQALSLLMYEALIISQRNGFKYFDFGTSSVKMVGNENIFKFKESFGSIGLFRSTYKWKLNE